MNARVSNDLICMIRCMVGFVLSMIDVWLGMFDAMLIARYMFSVCV